MFRHQGLDPLKELFSAHDLNKNGLLEEPGLTPCPSRVGSAGYPAVPFNFAGGDMGGS